MEAGGLVVALIDKRLLPSGSTIVRMLTSHVNLGFIGHYIIVCGYNANNNTICVADPAAYEARVYVRLPDFEAARKAFGTDEDLLVISGKQGQLAVIPRRRSVSRTCNFRST